MRFLLSLVALSTLTGQSLADFHVGRADKTQLHANPNQGGTPGLKYTQYIACPSNYYNCNCFGSIRIDRGVEVRAGGSTTGSSFSLASGLCGMGQLDFYYRPNLGHWEFYVAGGNGEVQGTCYKNDPPLQGCGIGPLSVLETNYQDQLVCYSYICNP